MVKVTYTKDDKEYLFDYFENEQWATYHIALAKSTSGREGFVDYTGAEFKIQEVEE